MDLADLAVRYRVEGVGDVLRSLKDVEQGVQQTAKAAGQAAATAAHEASRIGRAFGALASGIQSEFIKRTSGSFLDLAGQIISASASMEQLRARLVTAVGSVKEANTLFEQLYRFAKLTPFEFPELVQSAVNLENFGIRANEWLKTIGDTAAATGATVDQVTQAILDASVGEFERLKELGIKAIEEHGQTYLVYRNRQGEQIKAAIDRTNSDIILSTIQAIWNEKYADAMRQQSQTLIGQWSTLRDNVRALLTEMGGGLFEQTKLILAFSNTWFAHLDRLRDKGLKRLPAAFEAMRDAARDTFSHSTANLVIVMATGLQRVANALGSILVPLADFSRYLGLVVIDGDMWNDWLLHLPDGLERSARGLAIMTRGVQEFLAVWRDGGIGAALDSLFGGVSGDRLARGARVLAEEAWGALSRELSDLATEAIDLAVTLAPRAARILWEGAENAVDWVIGQLGFSRAGDATGGPEFDRQISLGSIAVAISGLVVEAVGDLAATAWGLGRDAAGWARERLGIPSGISLGTVMVTIAAFAWTGVEAAAAAAWGAAGSLRDWLAAQLGLREPVSLGTLALTLAAFAWTGVEAAAAAAWGAAGSAKDWALAQLGISGGIDLGVVGVEFSDWSLTARKNLSASLSAYVSNALGISPEMAGMLAGIAAFNLPWPISVAATIGSVLFSWGQEGTLGERLQSFLDSAWTTAQTLGQDLVALTVKVADWVVEFADKAPSLGKTLGDWFVNVAWPGVRDAGVIAAGLLVKLAEAVFTLAEGFWDGLTGEGGPFAPENLPQQEVTGMPILLAPPTKEQISLNAALWMIAMMDAVGEAIKTTADAYLVSPQTTALQSESLHTGSAAAAQAIMGVILDVMLATIGQTVAGLVGEVKGGEIVPVVLHLAILTAAVVTGLGSGILQAVAQKFKELAENFDVVPVALAALRSAARNFARRMIDRIMEEIRDAIVGEEGAVDPGTRAAMAVSPGGASATDAQRAASRISDAVGGFVRDLLGGISLPAWEDLEGALSGLEADLAALPGRFWGWVEGKLADAFAGIAAGAAAGPGTRAAMAVSPAPPSGGGSGIGGIITRKLTELLGGIEDLEVPLPKWTLSVTMPEIDLSLGDVRDWLMKKLGDLKAANEAGLKVPLGKWKLTLPVPDFPDLSVDKIIGWIVDAIKKLAPDGITVPFPVPVNFSLPGGGGQPSGGGGGGGRREYNLPPGTGPGGGGGGLGLALPAEPPAWWQSLTGGGQPGGGGGAVVTVTVKADLAPLRQAMAAALQIGEHWNRQRFVADLAGDMRPALLASLAATALGRAWERQRFIAAFGAAIGAVASAYAGAVAIGNAWARQVFTARFSVDLSPLWAALATVQWIAQQISDLLPHSPARSGPLARPISFAYIAEQARRDLAPVRDILADILHPGLGRPALVAAPAPARPVVQYIFTGNLIGRDVEAWVADQVRRGAASVAVESGARWSVRAGRW